MLGILIVEDSPTQAEHLKALLMKGGRFEVTVSGNSASALEAVRQRKPRLIISDILMPEMDGFALCQEIKAAENLKDIPVRLLTSLSSLQDILKGLECGTDNFLRKPVDEKHLRSRIDHVLSKQGLRSRERTRLRVTVHLADQSHFITAEHQQILDLLFSTAEEAALLNNELRARQAEFRGQADEDAGSAQGTQRRPADRQHR